MVTTNNFPVDLKLSEPSVALVKGMLMPHFDNITPNEDYRYDLLAKKGTNELTFEVKWDDELKNTGNLAVEYESWGKPSGIITTQSDYWVFVDSYNNLYWIETTKLRELCPGLRKAVAIKNESKNKLYLLPLRDFKHNFIELNNILAKLN